MPATHPLTLDAWNGIITQVNDLSANPPEGRSALPPLALAPDGHRWSVSDITTVRSRLQNICSSNSFSAPLVLWRQAIIDEINAAISNGWCGGGAAVPEWTVEPLTFHPNPRYLMHRIDSYVCYTHPESVPYYWFEVNDSKWLVSYTSEPADPPWDQKKAVLLYVEAGGPAPASIDFTVNLCAFDESSPPDYRRVVESRSYTILPVE